jgi:hypothetical protein
MHPEAAAPTVSPAIALLEALGTELAGRGWPSRLVREPGRLPYLHVANPEPGAAALAEDIYCAPRVSEWWFWWSWAEPLAADPAGGAEIITRVLRATGPL